MVTGGDLCFVDKNAAVPPYIGLPDNSKLTCSDDCLFLLPPIQSFVGHSDTTFGQSNDLP